MQYDSWLVPFFISVSLVSFYAHKYVLSVDWSVLPLSVIWLVNFSADFLQSTIHALPADWSALLLKITGPLFCKLGTITHAWNIQCIFWLVNFVSQSYLIGPLFCRPKHAIYDLIGQLCFISSVNCLVSFAFRAICLVRSEICVPFVCLSGLPRVSLSLVGTQTDWSPDPPATVSTENW